MSFAPRGAFVSSHTNISVPCLFQRHVSSSTFKDQCPLLANEWIVYQKRRSRARGYLKKSLPVGCRPVVGRRLSPSRPSAVLRYPFVGRRTSSVATGRGTNDVRRTTTGRQPTDDRRPETTKRHRARARWRREKKTSRQRPTLARASPALPSAMEPLTSVFGMGTGMTTPLWPPAKNRFAKLIAFSC